jgi:hexosaminidase
LQHTTQLTPMDHLVDALIPDPPSRHDMQVLVRDYLAHRDAETRDRLDAIFAGWIAAGPQAQKLMAASPLMMDESPRAQQAVDLGTTGRQALAYLDKHEAGPAGWKQTKLSLIEQAEKPVGLVRFTMLKPLGELVKAVQN